MSQIDEFIQGMKPWLQKKDFFSLVDALSERPEYLSVFRATLAVGKRLGKVRTVYEFSSKGGQSRSTAKIEAARRNAAKARKAKPSARRGR